MRGRRRDDRPILRHPPNRSCGKTTVRVNLEDISDSSDVADDSIQVIPTHMNSEEEMEALAAVNPVKICRSNPRLENVENSDDDEEIAENSNEDEVSPREHVKPTPPSHSRKPRGRPIHSRGRATGRARGGPPPRARGVRRVRSRGRAAQHPAKQEDIQPQGENEFSENSEVEEHEEHQITPTIEEEEELKQEPQEAEQTQQIQQIRQTQPKSQNFTKYSNNNQNSNIRTLETPTQCPPEEISKPSPTYNDSGQYSLDSAVDQMSFARVVLESFSMKKIYRFDLNEAPVHYCQRIARKLAIIGTSSQVSSTPKVAVFFHDNGLRFTICETNVPNPIGFMANGLAGAAITSVPLAPGISARLLRIAVPLHTPYNAPSKAMELSRIALDGISVEGVQIYESVLPHQKVNGELALHFGKYYTLPSIKNMLVRDPNSLKPLFLFLRISKPTFSLRYDEEVFSPLVAFAIASVICYSRS